MSEIIKSKEKIFPRQKGVKIDPYADQETISNQRIVKNIGYNVETPRTAYENYVDSKCPFTGDVVVRGGFFEGEVMKMKAEKTIVVQRNYLFFVKKYKRYKRRKSRYNVHLSPCFNGLIQVGDTVMCGETRPLSKTKNFAVIKIVKKASDNNVKEFAI